MGSSLLSSLYSALKNLSGGHETSKKPQTRNIPSSLILGLIMILSFSIRLYSVVKFESVIHEFDPWFNFRATEYLVNNGWKAFLNWKDEKVWHPIGRLVGKTVYPGMIVVSALAYQLFNKVLAFPIELRNICVFMGPVFSSLTCLSTFLVTKEISSNSEAGLLAAAFMAVIPGYISRSVAGSFDYEAISIFQMMTTFYFWMLAVRKARPILGILAAFWYFFMASSWGGYVFVINLIPLHTLALLCLGMDVRKLHAVYSPFYVVALTSAMTIPFISHQPIDTSEHMGAMIVFIVLQIARIYDELYRLNLSPKALKKVKIYGSMILGAAIASSLGMLKASGKVVPWAGRFYSLWDTNYAKKHIPIIASVSEHQPTSWATFFLDMQFLMVLFPLGVYFGIFESWASNKIGAVFLALYSVTASYFAAVMVRLILTLSPVICIASGIGLSKVLRASSEKGNRVQAAFTYLPLLGVVLLFLWHCCFVTHNAYSSPSIMLASYDREGRVVVVDDFREIYSWIRNNTPEKAKILAWWDYGYQINGMTDRTTIVDNNTWKNEHIALVGRILASDERTAHKLCKELGVDYVLVLFGGIAGFSGDDLNKFLWMIRIAQGVFPEHVSEQSFYNARGEYRMDDEGASPTLKASLMYKLSYYGMKELLGPRAVDRARRVNIANVDPKISLFTPVYSSENFIMRVYKVN
jgi:dolichyl-diphosphooligosaccharide---protein glycosyltransferase